MEFSLLPLLLLLFIPFSNGASLVRSTPFSGSVSSYCFPPQLCEMGSNFILFYFIFVLKWGIFTVKVVFFPLVFWPGFGFICPLVFDSVDCYIWVLLDFLFQKENLGGDKCREILLTQFCDMDLLHLTVNKRGGFSISNCEILI